MVERPAGDDRTATRHLSLRMPSRREAVGPTVDRVLQLTRDVGFDEERVHDLSVALSEALSNAAVHGNRLAADATVQLRVEIQPGRRAVIEVEDSGAGFDVCALADPTGDECVMRDNGRGVFLMGRLSDALEYNAVGNAVRMVFDRHARGRASGREPGPPAS